MTNPIEKRKTKTEYFLQEKPKNRKGWCYETGPFETLEQIERPTRSWDYDHRIVKRTTKIVSEEVIGDPF